MWCEVLHARMWCSLIYTIQTIFVATGCDYISFFSGIGKATFLRYFYQHAEFISSGKYNLPGTLADVDIEANSRFLAFLRLVGTVYSKTFPLLWSSRKAWRMFFGVDNSLIPIHYNSIVVGLMKLFGIGYNLRVRWFLALRHYIVTGDEYVGC